MLQHISVLLLSLALLAHSLPRPLEWFFSTTTQETLDAGQIEIRPQHYGDWGSQEQQPPGAPPAQNGNKTIYEVICADPQFSKLSKAVNFSESIIPLLNDSSAKLTFFAVPDWAFKRPKHILDDEQLSTTSNLADVMDYLDALGAEYNLDDNGQDKEGHKLLKALVSAILRYHVLTAELPSLQPAEISTFPTNLSLQYALDDEAQRIRVQTSLIPPSMVINLYSRVVRPNVQTSNGIIHVVNCPLIPPFPAFSQVFSIPRYFSFFTSAFQRSALADDLDLHWVSGKKDQEGHFTGTSTVTAFIPSNSAFKALPKNLQLYLFSPFGARVLKKLLQFHVVPDLSLHTVWDPFFHIHVHFCAAFP
ncbi:hypothetical protein BDZ89DRAFT_1141548 [Hymenopellis radicata]|nr:hypothetical protein BDZ89DRAFT_1141548 [Hymenopellis radicata]